MGMAAVGRLQIGEDDHVCHPPLLGQIRTPTTMMGIPAGPFAMGSEEYADEEPVHEVYLDDYLIDRDEISVAQYRGGVEAGICLEPARGEACNWGRRPRHRLI